MSRIIMALKKVQDNRSKTGDIPKTSWHSFLLLRDIEHMRNNARKVRTDIRRMETLTAKIQKQFNSFLMD